jgi:hypothetical protein
LRNALQQSAQKADSHAQALRRIERGGHEYGRPIQ